jgi:hypothetical protein
MDTWPTALRRPTMKVTYLVWLLAKKAQEPMFIA